MRAGDHARLPPHAPPPDSPAPAHHRDRLRESQQARLGGAHAAGSGAGGVGAGAGRDLGQHLGGDDAGVFVHRAGLADRRVGEQLVGVGAGGRGRRRRRRLRLRRRQPRDGDGEVRRAPRLLPRLLHLLHPVGAVLRPRELPHERARRRLRRRAAGGRRTARRGPRRQLLGGGAPRALPRHGAAHVGVRPRPDARLLRTHRGRAPPARHQLHAAAPPPVHGEEQGRVGGDGDGDGAAACGRREISRCKGRKSRQWQHGGILHGFSFLLIVRESFHTDLYKFHKFLFCDFRCS
uniref:Uncharacterized protein n=1 Tax=Oryza punctata TaxID=4537 RepID=A0A0E0LZW1_ORYPU